MENWSSCDLKQEWKGNKALGPGFYSSMKGARAQSRKQSPRGRKRIIPGPDDFQRVYKVSVKKKCRKSFKNGEDQKQKSITLISIDHRSQINN